MCNKLVDKKPSLSLSILLAKVKPAIQDDRTRSLFRKQLILISHTFTWIVIVVQTQQQVHNSYLYYIYNV